MNIAFIGTRGIPASHGGFETCVEEVGRRLVLKGHQVTVYSRKPSDGIILKTYEGMNIVVIPRLPVKGVETLLASLCAVVHSLFCCYDMHMIFDNANSPCLLIYKMLGRKCAINTDGLGWKREKWGRYASAYYKWSEWLAVKLCRNIVTDSGAMHDYYKETYRATSTIIEYGAYIPGAYKDTDVDRVLDGYGLRRKKYILQVTRFEPENNPLLTVRAFLAARLPLHLMIIGGPGRKSSYAQQLYDEAAGKPEILLPGFIYDKRLLEILWSNALCYVHGNSVGGTNPALLQAMAAGRPVLALDCVFNRQTLDENGFFFSRDVVSLKEKMADFFNHSPKAEALAKKAFERVKLVYNWERIAGAYEAFFNRQ